MNEANPGRAPRRRARRTPPKSAARVTCRRGTLGLGPNLALKVLDLSETGIRLLVREDLPRNLEIEIGLEGLGHPRPLRVTARVVWSVPTADGRFCLGAQFHRPLTYADMHALARF